MLKQIGCISLALVAGVAFAQDGRRPDSGQPVARAPAPVYEPAFDGYRAWTERATSTEDCP